MADERYRAQIDAERIVWSGQVLGREAFKPGCIGYDGMVVLDGDPLIPEDPANKKYVDAQIAGVVTTPGPPGATGATGGTGGTGPAGHDSADYNVEEVTATTKAMAINTTYITNNGSQVVCTLPVTAVLGSRINLVGKGTGGWKIAQGSGQVVHFLGLSTASGTGGYLASTTQYDCLDLICITANSTWVVTRVMGNITIS